MPDSTLVLLGAGASVDAGLPTSAELTSRLLSYMSSMEQHSGLDAAFRYVHHVVEADVASRRQSGGVDIERLFAVIDMLADLDSHPLSPFVGTWSGGLTRLSVDSMRRHRFADAFKRAVSEAAGIGSFGINQLYEELTENQTTTGSLFGRLRKQILMRLPEELGMASGADVSYLQPLLSDAPRACIVSLNYDLVIESLAEEMGLSLSTGVANWSLAEGLEWHEDAVHLVKLHGSIDWSMDWQDETFTPEPPATMHRRPAVIFGEGNKLNPAGPFLDLYNAFKTRLRAANSVLVIGYSFRDPHVNSALINWATRDPTRRIAYVAPGAERLATGMWRDDVATATVRRLIRQTGIEPPSTFRIVSKSASEGVGEALIFLNGE